jgi:Ca-activated chloride channel family protein
MRFVYPWLLLLLAVIPLLGLVWFWMERQTRRRLADLVAPALQPRLMPSRSKARFYIQMAGVLSGLALLTLAAARPQWGRQREQVVTRSRNVVIALDVSRSMLARDVHPNRLERAKVDIMDLIGELRGDRAALLAFRRRGILLCPLTTDYAFLRQALDGVSIDSAPRGETDLADAIRKSLDALAPAQDDANAILLISDGEDLAGAALDAARESRKRGVPIFAVGIGDTRGAAIPEESGGSVVFQGETVRTRLVEESLSAIARESGGRYVSLGTAGTAQTTLGAIFRQHLRQVSSREQQERIEHRAVERYQYFLIPSILLLLAAALLSHGRLAAQRRRTLPETAEERSSADRLPARFEVGQPARAAERAGHLGDAAPPSRAAERPHPPILPAARVLIVLLCAGIARFGTAAPATSTPDDPAATAPSAEAVVPADTNAVVVPAGHAGAREAQALYRRGKYEDAASAYVSAARGADSEESETYLFNAALSRHRCHADAAAMELLQPLTHSPRIGDRAAELLGLCAFDCAAATNGAGAAEAKEPALEDAGGAFQEALRNRPDDARRRRNLARVENQLPAIREEARISRLLKQYGQTPPEQLIDTLLREQRALLDETPTAFTNEAAEQIRRLDSFADRQDRACDLWVPLKRAVLQSPALTNEQQRAEFERGVELTRDAMSRASGKMRDIDPSVCPELTRLEPPVYLFWRGLSGPPALLDEDIALQSNALVRADHPLVPHRPDQPEALQLTRDFQKRFPSWADQIVQAALTDTNAPTLKPEDREEIERLTGETVTLQQQAAGTEPSVARAHAQRRALANLLRIRELLPKQKSQSQQQPQPQSKPQEQPQQPQPKPPQEPQEPPKPEEQPKADKQDQPPQNIQDLLQQALQREKERETEKHRQMNRIPMLPNERDW